MRNKGFITWLFIVVAVLLLLNLPGPVSYWTKSCIREGVAPLQQVFSQLGVRIRESSLVFRGLGGILKKNRELSEEIIHLRSKVRELEAVEGENIRLRSQLHFAQRSSRRLIPAEVIGRDVNDWWRSMRINGGTRDGIVSESAVITSEGLVGKTVDVSRRITEVLLLSDPKNKVSAQISRSGAFGVLEGTGTPLDGCALCRMSFINKNASVRVGDEVMTSGLGGVYPQGLVIGYVESVEMDEAGLYQAATVIPKVDVSVLRYVFVVSEEDDTIADLLRDKGPVAPISKEEE